mgnify:CR=1 FL=1
MAFFGLIGSAGYVTCTACNGSGITSGDCRDFGCTRCGGSGDTGNSPDAIWGHQKNTLSKGSGRMKVPDVAAHERQQDKLRKARRAREIAERNQPDRGR